VPVTPTHPGVYIEEVPSGVHPITGVATSTAAFLDFFPRGPLDVAIRIQSFADFEREFGGLDARSEASYAIQQYFLNGGSEAWVVRVGTVASGGLATAAVKILDTAGKNPTEVLSVSAGQQVRGRSVVAPGAWGESIRVEVDYDVAASSDPAQEFGELFNLTISEISPASGRLRTVRSETYRNLTTRPHAANTAWEVVNESSKMVQIEALEEDAEPPIRPAANGTLGAPVSAKTEPLASEHELAIELDTTGPGAGKYTATIPAKPPSPANPVDLARFAPILQQAIRTAERQPPGDPVDPLISGATVRLVKADAAGDEVRLHVLAGRGGASFDPKARIVFDKNDEVAIKLGLDSPAAAQVQQYALEDGKDGSAPFVSAEALRGSRAAKTGLYALEDVDLFNILCVPASAELATGFEAVVSECATYCAGRRAFLLVDIPKSVRDPAGMELWMGQNDSLRSENAAVYFPRPQIADPLNGNRLRSVGASGTIAGLFARTDATRGVWKAPAGTEARLRGVQEQTYALTDAENGTLNPLGVNCLRNFPVHGNVSWGGRTLHGADQQASEWKYVPVRRLALFLEESLYRGTKWVVFEPNDEPLWAQVRLNVGAFMHDLFRKGAFQGATPREAYLVKCDRETTTQTDVNNGVVNILVGFAPLKPAEFVIVRIQQLAGQIET
jgi:Bacteriophage tail sheath protein